MGRAHKQGTAEPGNLGEGDEDFWLGWLARLFLFDVAGYADNLRREALIHIVDDELPADWILIREIFPRHRLVDDRHLGGVRQVAVVKFAPGAERRLQRTEITRADGAVSHHRVAVGQRIALTVELEVQPPQRRITHQRHRRYSWRGGDAFHDLLSESEFVLRGEPERHHHQALRVVAGVNAEQSCKAVDEQPGSDEQR